MGKLVRLIGDTQRAYAKRLCDEAPANWVAKFGEETRSDAQNRLMWPLIADMREQIPEMATFSADQVKLRFLDALGDEMVFLPKLEGAGMFPVGQRSSTLTKEQFSGLIELMFAHGAKHGVQWSRRSEETRAEMAQAKREPPAPKATTQFKRRA